MMLTFSSTVIVFYSSIFVRRATLIALSLTVATFLAPLLGWLADVRFGRYEIIKFGLLVSFFVSILFYLAVFIEGLRNVFSAASIGIARFGSACFLAAMLPFLTDQIIGATSDELSAVVQWYIWADNFGHSLSLVTTILFSNLVETTVIFAVPLAVIIISDCLCQQWSDRTHKVTNPIKLIIQVFNYTRKHSYPERRSAFTYIDEEQPTRMDFGK